MRQVRLSCIFEMMAAALTPNQTPPGHYGLSMMRERAAAVGATLSIISQPGHGTEIIIRWAETPGTEGRCKDECFLNRFE